MPSQLERITKQYPRLRGHDWAIVDSRKTGKGNGQLEFYMPEEPNNPQYGRPTIEVFNPELQGEALDRAIMGDMLHYLPDVDPKWRQMRQEFVGTLTPQQRMVDRNAYQRAREERGELRSFEKWFDVSRADAYLRGYLAPDQNDEWRDVYTQEQRDLLEFMRYYLQSE